MEAIGGTFALRQMVEAAYFVIGEYTLFSNYSQTDRKMIISDNK
jgi:hypothetical protein